MGQQHQPHGDLTTCACAAAASAPEAQNYRAAVSSKRVLDGAAATGRNPRWQ